MLTNIQSVVIAGFCLVAMSTASALTGRADALSRSSDQIAQSGSESAAENRNPVGQTAASDVKTPGVPQVPPFIVAPSVNKLAKPLDIIRIGRLELRRKDENGPKVDELVPYPYDPLETVRATLGLLPNPPIKISFDIKWGERNP